MTDSLVPYNWNEMTEEERCAYKISLGDRLQEHRYRYYVEDAPVLPDYEYDYLERLYEWTCVELGHPPTASNMVGFDPAHPDAQGAADRVDSETDHWSLDQARMREVWQRLGPPNSARKKAQLDKEKACQNYENEE